MVTSVIENLQNEGVNSKICSVMRFTLKSAKLEVNLNDYQFVDNLKMTKYGCSYGGLYSGGHSFQKLLNKAFSF